MGLVAIFFALSTLTLFLAMGSATTAELKAPHKPVQFSVPTIHLNDLDQDHEKLRKKLSEFGMIAVTDIPDLGQLRKAVFSSMLDCSKANSPAFELTSALDVSTSRRAIASETVRHVPRPLSANVVTHCPDLASAAPSFRNVISEVSNAFTSALDRQYVLHMARFKQPPYSSFASVQTEGSQLEHFVTYTSSSSSSSTPLSPPSTSDSDVAADLELHVDEGLFIAFVPPLLNQEGEAGSGLVVQLPSGELATAKYECSDCVVFMMGGGFSRWLGANVPGVVHALRMPVGASRAWYGRMFLPPSDAVAILPSGTVIDFATYRTMHNSSTFLEENGLSCMERSVVRGNVIRRLADDCPNKQFHCWMKCYTAAELPACNSKEMMLCAANSDGRECSFNQMGCGPRCVASNSSAVAAADGATTGGHGAVAPVEDSFCDARSAVTMYMEGFIWPSSATRQSCVRMLFVPWVLDTPSKYTGGCIGTFLFGMFVEFLSVLRRQIKPEFSKPVIYALSMLVLGAQATCGYFLMFLAMTFSIPIFMAAVFGLMVGHGVFNIGVPKSTDRPHC